MIQKITFYFFCVFLFNSTAISEATSNTLVLKSDSIDELGKAPARLKWQKTPGAKFYFLTVSQSKDFEKGRVFKVEKNKMFLMVHPNTTYFWKIEPMSEESTPIATSTPSISMFVVQYSGPIPEPKRQMASEVQTGDMCDTDLNPLRKPDSETQIQIQNPSTFDSTNPYSLTLATEAGYLSFQQTHSALSSAESSGTMFPSIGVNFQTKKYWNQLSFKILFQQIIGNFSNDTSAVTLINNDFQWVRYGASSYWDAYETPFFSRDLLVRPYVGIESQKTPYFVALSPTAISIDSMDMVNATLGLRLEFKNATPWSYIFDMNYSQSLSASTDSLGISDIKGDHIEALVGTQYSATTSGFYVGGNLKSAFRNLEETVTTQSNQTSIGDRKIIYYSIEGFAGFRF
ncbi:MAG: hypothetical protein IT287_03230 [Bdellovibrionaceae bacterium]|nr:hypothetical protein [Pseudobdellovibrionaceae bacterium]